MNHLSHRDYFAAQALQGLMTKVDTSLPADQISLEVDRLAWFAMEAADSLLAWMNKNAPNRDSLEDE